MTPETSNDNYEPHIGRFIDRWMKTNSLNRIRTSLRLAPRSAPTPLTRAYLRGLRAAELAAWELTGGDFVRSSFVAQACPASGAACSGRARTAASREVGR